MTSATSSSPGPHHPSPRGPNQIFRELRGSRSPGEFAAAVRRAAREIGEQVSCDARYIGRVESGEIRCPNYAYERVFRHMFPGRDLRGLGFETRQAVRGRRARPARAGELPGPRPAASGTNPAAPALPGPPDPDQHDHQELEESDVLRRAFMTGGSAALAVLGPLAGPAAALPENGAPAGPGDPFDPFGALAGLGTGGGPGQPSGALSGKSSAAALEEAVRTIRLLDDRLGADRIYRQAAASLRLAHELLDTGPTRQSESDRLHAGAGELAISVGWLAHDSRRYAEARSHYSEALATARMSNDPALEAHAFCNASFLARDTGRPREAVRAAQAGQQAARDLPSDRLRALLALREACGWAGLGDRNGCLTALNRGKTLFERGPSAADPEWMSFFGEAELAGLESQCWTALGESRLAAERAREAVSLQDPHFVRNRALFTAKLADDLARGGEVDEAAAAALRSLTLLGEVRSTRITGMLRDTAATLAPHAAVPDVAVFLSRV